MSETKPTAEQIAEFEATKEAYQKEMTPKYKKEIPFLKLQAEYEGLHAQIIQSRLTQLMGDQKLAEFRGQFAQQPKQPAASPLIKV